MLKRSWLAVILIICWAYVFGTLATVLSPGSSLLEFAAVVSGASVGLLISWQFEYLIKNLKSK